eukprot:9929412-Ditylum_brightwellii.AAC.2
MREAIPLIELLNEIRNYIRVSEDKKAESKCTVFKDNNGCIELAICQRMRPRTMHIPSVTHRNFQFC